MHNVGPLRFLPLRSSFERHRKRYHCKTQPQLARNVRSTPERACNDTVDIDADMDIDMGKCGRRARRECARGMDGRNKGCATAAVRTADARLWSVLDSGHAAARPMTAWLPSFSRMLTAATSTAHSSTRGWRLKRSPDAPAAPAPAAPAEEPAGLSTRLLVSLDTSRAATPCLPNREYLKATPYGLDIS